MKSLFIIIPVLAIIYLFATDNGMNKCMEKYSEGVCIHTLK